MENKKLVLMLVTLMISADAVNAGGIGDPCSSPCDCEGYLACHNGLCDKNCYSHLECATYNILGYSCNWNSPWPSKKAIYCGSGNTCVDALFFQSCDKSMVCPECECTPQVCYDYGDFFMDGLDNGRIYCRSFDFDCFHLEKLYHNAGYVYLPDTLNVYKCEQGFYWSNPVCTDGYVWDSVKYPEGEWSTPPNDGCMPKPITSPEVPTVVLIVLVLSLGIVYGTVRKKGYFE